MSERDLNVVVFGATGFTGRLAAEYLAKHAPAELRWGLAGRARPKLEAVRDDLGLPHDLPLIEADSADPPSLEQLAARTQVVITTVGPYARLGEGLVGACARAGTDYCDLTGEVTFMRRMIDRYHEVAKETGARIVHTCGFDSIPSDLGVWMMHRAFEDAGLQLEKVRFFMGKSYGGFSGGTVASMLMLMEAAERDPEVRRLLVSPYALDPEGPRASGPDGRDPLGVTRTEVGWTGPFVMASVNTRVVRRSNALLGYPYGEGFQYSEQASFGRGMTGLIGAGLMSAGAGAVLALGMRKRTRQWLARALPKPGEGPSEKVRREGYFRIRLLAAGTDADGTVANATGVVEGDGDPGYSETAKMISESALALVDTREGAAGGVLTPASAMGDRLLERLRNAGMRFRVTEAPGVAVA